MSFPLINPYQQFFDSSGAPLASGTIEFRDPTSNNLISSYPTADDADAQTNANANPLTLSSTGAATSGLYLEDGVDYKIVLKDSDGNTVTTQDDVLCPRAANYYAITAAETSAGVTPTNYQYEPGNVLRYGIIADGATDQTTEINALTAAFGSASQRVTFDIPQDTVFNPITVLGAIPDGINVEILDSTNWGQPPGYRNRFKMWGGGDSVSDDTQFVIYSNHNAALQLLNTGESGSASGLARRASILHTVGQDSRDDPQIGWLQQFSKGTGDEWIISWRMQTPYDVAIANPDAWVTSTVYAAGAYCISDSGKVYKTTAGGTSGATAPTGTGSPNDGGVVWVYQQSALNIDSTRMELDEGGDWGTYGPVSVTWTQKGGARSHAISIDPATNDILWRDTSRGLNILKVTDTLGLQFGHVESKQFAALTGATPTLATSYGYVTNSGATTMTALSLPTSQTQGYCMLMFGDGNTTITHGTNFQLKGGVDATPASGAIIELVKYTTHSGQWIEKSRNY